MSNIVPATNIGMNDLDRIVGLVGQIAELQAKSTERDDTLSSQISEVSKQMLTVSERVNYLTEDVNGVKEELERTNANFYKEIENIKSNGEIEEEQRKTLVSVAARRVMEITGFDEFERAKYYRGFICRLWSDAKKYGGVGSTVATTRKKNFQRAIDYIEAWVPRNGIAQLKKEIDDKARARRLAKEKGYNP